MVESSRKVAVGEAAEHLGLSASTLNKLRCAGGGPLFIKIGAQVLYEVADLDAWAASFKRRSTSDCGYAPPNKGARSGCRPGRRDMSACSQPALRRATFRT